VRYFGCHVDFLVNGHGSISVIVIPISVRPMSVYCASKLILMLSVECILIIS